LARVFLALSVCIAIVLSGAFNSSGTALASAKQQIVFSGTGFGTFTPSGGTATPSPFGFWIWCEDEDAANPYASFCGGSIYVYALGLTKGVFGVTSDTGLPSGSHRIHAWSRDGLINCDLVNSPPVTSGPTNTVTMTCSAPAGSGVSTNSVVVITGQ
jgi:hypothetical protein